METNDTRTLYDIFVNILYKNHIDFHQRKNNIFTEIELDLPKKDEYKGINTIFRICEDSPESALHIDTEVTVHNGYNGPQRIISASTYIKKEDLLKSDSPLEEINKQLKWCCGQMANIIYDQIKL